MTWCLHIRAVGAAISGKDTVFSMLILYTYVPQEMIDEIVLEMFAQTAVYIQELHPS